jgi:diguanylate cyclase (GGDEF)-like protein
VLLLKLLSIRGLLVIMVLLASTPSLFILTKMRADSDCRILTAASQNAAGLADNLATTQRIVDTWLLSMFDLLVEEPEIKRLDVNGAAPLLTKLMEKLPMLEGIFLLDASGGVLLSAKEHEFVGLREEALRESFSCAGSEDRPLVGGVISVLKEPEAEVADLAGSDSTPRYLPYIRHFGSGYILLLVKASYFEECIEHFMSSMAGVSQKWVMAILDASGAVVACRASTGFEGEGERWEKEIRDPLWDQIARREEKGSFSGLWGGKKDCVAGYAKIRLPHSQGESPVHAVAVVSYFLSDVLKKERTIALRFLFLSLVFVFGGLLFALGVGRKLLVIPIERLAAANERFAMGILSSRANIQNGIREMRVLSKSFDDMADALERQELRRRSETAMIKEQAHRDYLTGTYNRRGGLLELERHIEEAKKYAALLSIFFVDIDFFKSINDDYGHNEGDKMLKRITFLLERHLRSGDVLCRYGGDEFLVILPKCAMTAADAVWKRIEREIRLLNESGKVPYPVSLSHGWAVFDPLAPISIDDLINEADVKMYKEKAKHKAASQKKTERSIDAGSDISEDIPEASFSI